MIKLIILIFLYFFSMNVYPNNKEIETDLKSIIKETNYIKKISLLNKVYKNYPNYKKRFEIGYELANLYILDNEYDKAILLLNEIIESPNINDTYSFNANLMLANLYSSEELPNDALKIYNALLLSHNEKDDIYYDILYGIANSYFQIGSYYEARGNYERIINGHKEFENMPHAMYNLALSYEGIKNNDLAITTYSNIVRMYPNTYSSKMAAQKLTLFALEKKEEKVDEVKKVSSKKDDIKIFKANGTRTFQMGRFRDKVRAKELGSIIKNIGYSSYIIDESKNGKISYVVRLDLPNDKRNIDELRKRFSSESIPFFEVRK